MWVRTAWCGCAGRQGGIVGVCGVGWVCARIWWSWCVLRSALRPGSLAVSLRTEGVEQEGRVGGGWCCAAFE
eukprot:3782617-Prorocentrum_lima.AAC.1